MRARALRARAGKAWRYARLTRDVAALSPSMGAAARTVWAAALLWPLRGLQRVSRVPPITVAHRESPIDLVVTDPDDLGTVREVLGDHAYAVSCDRVASIVDLGANIGVASRYFHAVYPDARILAVEPDPRALEVLRANVAGVAEITVAPVAVGAESAQNARLFLGRGTVSSSLSAPVGADADRGSVHVVTVSLDELLASHAISAVDLLKIDIEGAEFDVLRSFRGLSEVRAIAGEFHEMRDGPTAEEFFALLRDFRLQIHREGWLHGFAGIRAA